MSLDLKEKELVKEKVLEIFKSNEAVIIASTGGEYSPWILGAYYASDDLKMYLFIDTLGKTMNNFEINKNIAISISKNDAMQDFLQGSGEIVILNESEESKVREMLVAKMPWFKTYTPVTPVRIDLKKVFVSSFNDHWFPAKVLEV